MDDVALYTVYYGSYQVRNAEAQLPSPVSRKRQGAVCACLVFGAACGLSTVAVGIFVHNPAITWPVVAVGLIGVVVGVILAHQQATGGWPHRLPSARQSGRNGNVSERQQPADANRCTSRPPLYNTPIYCAEALDLDTDLVAGAKYTDGFGGAHTAEWGVDESEDSDEGPSKHPRPQPQAPLLPFAEAEARGAATAAAAAAAAAAGPLSSSPAPATAAAMAAGCGIVVCGVPLAGADGIVDTKPVLVLQPNTRLAPYGYGDVQGHTYGQQPGSPAMVEPAPSAAETPIVAAAAATAAAAAVDGAAGDPVTGASEQASPVVAAVVAAVPTTTEGGAGDVLAAAESVGEDDEGKPGDQAVWSVSAPTASASASAPSKPLELAEVAVPAAGLAGDAASQVPPATRQPVTASPGEALTTTGALPPQPAPAPAPAPAAASLRRARE